MTTLGKIEEFDVRGGKIDRYLERLQQYFVANDIPPDSETSSRQRAILISILGAEAYDILFDLCSPNSPSCKSFADLKTILKSHFAPKRLVVLYRVLSGISTHGACFWRAAWTPRGNPPINFVFPTPRMRGPRAWRIEVQ